MLKFMIILAGVAAAFGIYMYWTRKSPDELRSDLMSASAQARERASDLIDRTRDQVDSAGAQVRDQADRARDAVNAS